MTRDEAPRQGGGGRGGTGGPNDAGATETPPGWLSRRQVLKGGLVGAAGAVTAGAVGRAGLFGRRPGLDRERVREASTDAASLDGAGPPGSPVSLTVDGLVSPIGLDPG